MTSLTFHSVKRIIAAATLAAGATLGATAAKAEFTVECVSHHKDYHECAAGPLNAPELIYQESSAPCIKNRSWGFNRKTNRIWVSAGCRAVFADHQGYHHGASGTYDSGARHYDSSGQDLGAAAGALLGALVIGAIADGIDPKQHSGKPHHSSNKPPHKRSSQGQCHGVGCIVDNPDYYR